jgi:hypothetical protein
MSVQRETASPVPSVDDRLGQSDAVGLGRAAFAPLHAAHFSTCMRNQVLVFFIGKRGGKAAGVKRVGEFDNVGCTFFGVETDARSHDRHRRGLAGFR